MSAAADRSTISTQRAWVLTALVAAQLWAALSSLPRDSGSNTVQFVAAAAVVCAVLAMFGLRSIPIRWIVRSLTLVSGMLLARFGELGVYGGIGGSWKALLWLGATAAALASAPSSRSVPGEHGTVIRAENVPELDASIARTGTGAAPRSGGLPAALMVAAVCLIGATALLVGPRTTNIFPTGASAGEALDLTDNRQGNSLVAQDSLDMTGRPSLTERVVMNVRSPIASVWRTEIYDEWDGQRWTRSIGRNGELLTGGVVQPDEFDLAASDAATRGTVTEQEFRMEVGFATAVPSAPSPLSVDSSEPFAQRFDGTLVSPIQPMSRGTTYTVRSGQLPTNADLLRRVSKGPASERVPEALMERYATPPEASDRTLQLVEDLTAGKDNDYDRIQAIEAWFNDNTTYSLDAPLSPAGVDVVDHFLFEAEQGWCEQIATSFVVMARAAGIPARLATGFAPGDWDGVGGRFVVRESDAHAWAEVWFPEYGWVVFDPTAIVPLAGTADATAGAAAIDWREALGGALAVIGIVAIATGPLTRWVLRQSDRRRLRRRREQLVKDRWDVAEELRIEAVGRRAGRVRGPGETITVFADAVGGVVGDESMSQRGVEIDRHRYDTRR